MHKFSYSIPCEISFSRAEHIWAYLTACGESTKNVYMRKEIRRKSSISEAAGQI